MSPPSFPSSVKEKYNPIKQLPISGEGTVFLCVPNKTSSPAVPNANELEPDKPTLFAVKVFRLGRTIRQVSNLEKLKAAQASEKPDHASRKYFPKLYEIDNTLWQAMEAIRGATLKDLVPLIHNNGPWGAMFTCHLFLELHAAMSGLLDLKLVHTDINVMNIMFRYKHLPPPAYSLPGLILVDLNLENAGGVHEHAMTTGFLLNLCHEVCTGRFEKSCKSFPISQAAKSLVDPSDVDVIKELDEHLENPNACQIGFGELGRRFERAIDEIQGKRAAVDWPMRDLEQLLEKPLISDGEWEKAFNGGIK